jgi:homoserine O-acetyltransferase
MDLFDMSQSALQDLNLTSATQSSEDLNATPLDSSYTKSYPPPHKPAPHLPDLVEGLRPLARIPTLILGAQSDILMPIDQQREVADALRMAGNNQVSYYELGGVWGHDTFL